MKYLLSLLKGQCKRHSTSYSLILWLVFLPQANAINLQCSITDNTQIAPAIITTMLNAAEDGYLYYADASTSIITFKVDYFPFSTVEGNFDNFQGGLALPAGNNQSKQALFVIDTNSITTGDSDLDDHLKSSVFFNVIKFPEIIFISTFFEWIDESTARLHGNLTLHGTTKPLVFNMHIDTEENGDSDNFLTLSASAKIHRSDYGMHGLKIFVSDTVSFNLKINASRVRS